MSSLSTRIIWISFICAMILGCATPGAPTGGPMDKTAPKPVSFNPQGLSKDVKEKTFTITFDEWVQVANARQQVIISPPVQTFPDIVARKNDVTVRFKEDLQPNTTYSIFFGESIKDVRENNPAENINYVFSTGPYIDSLEISGQVTLPSGQTLPENTFVLLYTTMEDSAVVKEKPAYALKLNKGNEFSFKHLPAKTFRLLALSDRNNNLKYDLPTEWIGVYHKSIKLDSNVSGLKLPLILPEPELYKISEYNSTLQNGILQIRWNKPYHPQNDPFSVKILQAGTIIKKPQYNTRHNSVFYVASDSNTISCVIYDRERIIDTIRIRKDSGAAQNGMMRTTPQAVGKYATLSLYENQSISFESSIPFTNLDGSKISLLDSSGGTIPFHLEMEDSLWSFKVLPEIRQGQEYKLELGDSAIAFINKTFSKKESYTLVMAPTTLFGKLTFRMSLPSADTAYVVSIKTSAGKILEEAFVDGDTSFMYTSPPLTAGSYLVEVLEDRNRSKTWNGGSYWQGTSPERVFRSEAVNVKENWEQEIRIKVDFSNPVLPLPLPEEKEAPQQQEKAPTGKDPGPAQDRRPMFDR